MTVLSNTPFHKHHREKREHNKKSIKFCDRLNVNTRFSIKRIELSEHGKAQKQENIKIVWNANTKLENHASSANQEASISTRD